MGIDIQSVNLSCYPYQLEVTFECDGVTPPEILCRGFAKYSHGDGYKGCHSMAMADGWLERTTNAGRWWLCPTCSGKPSRETPNVE